MFLTYFGARFGHNADGQVTYSFRIAAAGFAVAALTA